MIEWVRSSSLFLSLTPLLQSTRDLTVCSEVKHVDLKKSLRYQRPPSKTQATTAAPPRNSKTPSREEKTPSSSAAPAMIADISVLSMCSCPDISFESYSPPGDRPDGVTLEQWRHFQTNALAGASKFALHFNYKPTICLLTSLGAPVLVDVEVSLSAPLLPCFPSVSSLCFPSGLWCT
jgi:hypothetical protein